MLSSEQIARYRADGYLLVENVFDGETIAALGRVTDEFVEASRAVAASDDVYDLDPAHTAAAPRVRRIKNPQANHPAYDAAMRGDALLDIVAALIGPDIRFDHSKLNFKPPGGGAAVEWHQDWAFYPHTNDDILAVGVMLDDCTADNGPLLAVPGSHKGPVWDHHAGGRFCGALDPSATNLDFGRARAFTGPAGSITIHHVRTVHGSTENRSDTPRRLLIYSFTATDAWPLLGLGDHGAPDIAAFDARIVRGEPTLAPRVVQAPVRIPLPPAEHDGSIYESQKPVEGRSFGAARAAG